MWTSELDENITDFRRIVLVSIGFNIYQWWLVELGVGKKQEKINETSKKLQKSKFSKTPPKITPPAQKRNIFTESDLATELKNPAEHQRQHSLGTGQKPLNLSELKGYQANMSQEREIVDLHEVIHSIGQFRTFGSARKENPEFYREFSRPQLQFSETDLFKRNYARLREELSNAKDNQESKYEVSRTTHSMPIMNSNNNSFGYKFQDDPPEESIVLARNPLNKTEKYYTDKDISQFDVSSRSTWKNTYQ